MIFAVHGKCSEDYRLSQPSIEVVCDCHPQIISTYGDRTGLVGDRPPFRPVYVLRSFWHPEVSGRLWTVKDGRLLPLAPVAGEGE